MLHSSFYTDDKNRVIAVAVVALRHYPKAKSRLNNIWYSNTELANLLERGVYTTDQVINHLYLNGTVKPSYAYHGGLNTLWGFYTSEGSIVVKTNPNDEPETWLMNNPTHWRICRTADGACFERRWIYSHGTFDGDCPAWWRN